ncbi:hypothetical protein QBC33DRAFT_614531 [Phialemonium atrogriseum]|uniref:EGF domain-specific O-linked N-acetylglucosamine transferase n=1 Tax=Phialemonium atrogriseum TaxID=1093897 RepID=A0AAJ0BPH9_9PEZI|nr:uncharacterized protein QBC33DRAFT_614531 [Phialemonium atrogriseum]KAK1762084.1 hypothetical protein QBC33DRAFT_614531 [Phialemonium atrogriseum]
MTPTQRSEAGIHTTSPFLPSFFQVEASLLTCSPGPSPLVTLSSDVSWNPYIYLLSSALAVPVHDVSMHTWLAADYHESGQSQPGFCADRFSSKYLQDLRDHAGSYCSPGSRSNLTCFHSRKASGGLVDSFCIGRGASFDVGTSKFALQCPVRTLNANETASGLVQFDQIRGYWYDTGPSQIFNNFVDIKAGLATPDRTEDQGKNTNDKATPPRFYLLLKREGETNPWHCLMEIWSAGMTLDVLSMTRDPLGNDGPFFRPKEDAPDTQVVILDDRQDGPYFDLWTLFAKRKPVRLKELLAAPAPSTNASIIVPLAGGSNPLWQNDWAVRRCTAATTLNAFSRRVLDFYGVTDDPPAPPTNKTTDDDNDNNNAIVVTFIDRTSTRRLQDQDRLFAALRERVPHVSVRLVDFAALPFAEQLRVARTTDVLVGVHGAGLTHAMSRAGVIQPADLRHNGFRNLAAMRGLGFFRVHAANTGAGGGGAAAVRRRGSWQWNDVRLEEERFLEVMSAAIKSLYARGRWNYDVN